MDALLFGQNEKAHTYLLRAHHLAPDDAQILLQLSILCLGSQQFKEAYDYISQAYTLDSAHADIVFFKAESAGCLGLMQEAKQYAELYLDMSPDGIYAEDALDILAFFDFEAEQEEQSTEELRAQEKARVLMEQGDFEQAINVLEDIIAAFPTFWSAYNNLALAYFYVGATEDAKEALQTVLRNDAGNIHAICNQTVIAYYDKDMEQLRHHIALLKKIQPYAFENRYKLGATLALIGEYDEAYHWLYSMQKHHFEGDTGYYFWLAYAAYHMGHERQAKKAWEMLVELDPTKEALAPWEVAEDKEQLTTEHLTFIEEKLSSQFSSDRLLGLFLASKSPFKIELLGDPSNVNIEQYDELEKMYLAHLLGHTFDQSPLEKAFLRATEVAEILYEHQDTMNFSVLPMFQLWFAVYEHALHQGYAFKNATAIAAANEYLFLLAHDEAVTKKAIALKYGISPATLNKYIDELLSYLPH